ncbi:hypothetical protein OBV_25150 [Oscillibacter valericigenes Sjm18-20]|nr:hypothetical protein OBV_25150 [Oscillibacter valericigenes Sjm18-20]
MEITVKSGQILHESKIYYTGETLEVTDDAGKLLIARGLAETEKEAAEQERSMEDMTVKELASYAAEHGIQLLTGSKKKADLIAAIRAAESGQIGEAAEGNSGADSNDGPVTEMPEE